MTAIDLTKLIGAATLLLSSVFLPLYLNRRKLKSEDAAHVVLTQASVAQMFKEERDRLQRRLDEIEASHEHQMAAMAARHRQEIEAMRVAHQVAIQEIEDKWRRTHTEDAEKIRYLRSEIDELYQRFYRQPPPPS